MLQSVLSDPAQMARITQAAQSIMGGQPPQDAPPNTDARPAATPAIPDGEAKLLSLLSRAFSQNKEKSRSAALLLAMRPYMKPEKQEKLDRAMQMARIAHIAGVVMQEYGGGFHGI